LRGVIKTLRPHQWVKNLFVLAPMFFHKDVFLRTAQGPALNLALTGRPRRHGVFCLLAGSIYTINDIADVAADRLHPVKRFRPIASGSCRGVAWAVAIALVVFSLGMSYLIAPRSRRRRRLLRREPRLHVQAEEGRVPRRGLIAFGFVLRVLAGGIATDVHVSATCSRARRCSPLPRFGKRRQELASRTRASRGGARGVHGEVAQLGHGHHGQRHRRHYVAYTLDPVTRAFFNTNYLWLTPQRRLGSCVSCRS